MFSIRTKLSLAQFLELQDQSLSALLLEKYGVAGQFIRYTTDVLGDLTSALLGANDEQLLLLLKEIAKTNSDLRHRISPRSRYDERYNDLKACMLLDGYLLDNGEVVAVDPSITDIPDIEDDLTRELKTSSLPNVDIIIQKLDDSSHSFRSSSPNYNACLNDARVALQTLATSIAEYLSSSQPQQVVDLSKWGSVIVYLKSSSFITEDEEKGLAGVFRFVSPGSHHPLGLSDEEFARLGRSFVAGICWFLVKRYHAYQNF